MTPGARIQSAIDLMEHLQSVWESDRRVPVDGMLADYFKKRRYIGSKDRGGIAEIVYFCLRNGATLQWHIESCDRQVTPRRVVLTALLFLDTPYEVFKIRDVCNGAAYAPKPLVDQEISMLDKLDGKPFLNDAMPMAARYNYPDWMEERLKDTFGDQLPEAMMALNEQAPIDLRANLLKCRDRGDLILALDKDGYFGQPTPGSPIGVRLQKRIAAFNTQAFKDGMFEMQDAGSQVVSLLVKAKPGDKVIDFCAGAGGKTLAIAATMKNKGRILAWDVSEHRLSQMGKRLARAGVSNVQTHVLKTESDPYIKRHVGTADWVIVDAPCSGSGTWRRNPDLKWRLTLDDLTELKGMQESILKQASRMVKPGGRLVYVTCSIFADENFSVVKQFLGGNLTFRVEAPDNVWNKHLIARYGVGVSMQLTPHKDGTDGFYAAVLVKDSATAA